MGKKGKGYDGSKEFKPGYRVQPGATNGPYAWGNGPQPEGLLKRLAKVLAGKRK